MSAANKHDWLEGVILDLVNYSGENNLQETAGKLADVYNLLKLERSTNANSHGNHIECKTSMVSLFNRKRIDGLENWCGES